MRGYSAFLPLFRSRRQWSDRFQDIDLPLFPGYVFSRLDVNHRLPALLIPGVVRFVGLGKIPVPVDEEEMTAVQAIVESGLFMRPFPFLKIGQTVTIQSSAAVSRRRAPAQFCSAGGGRRRLGRTAARDRRLGPRRLAGFRRTQMDAALDEQSRYHWNQRGWHVLHRSGTLRGAGRLPERGLARLVNSRAGASRLTNSIGVFSAEQSQ
jgi:hypothetical protein